MGIKKESRTYQDNAVLQEFVAGSNRLKFSDLFSGGDEELFQDPSWDLISDFEHTTRSLKAFIWERIARRSDGFPRILVIGGNGLGKTTIAAALYFEGMRCHAKNSKIPVPGLVRLGFYTTSFASNVEYFGSRLWMRGRGLTAYRLQKTWWHKVLKVTPSPMILDELDELLAHSQPEDLDTLLRQPLLREASVVTCSPDLYERLVSTDYIRGMTIVRLQGLSYESRLRFAEKYVAYLHRNDLSAPREPNDSGTLEEANLVIWRDQLSGASFREPLYLRLAIESVAQIGDLRTYLEYYVRSRLEREAVEGRRKLTPEQAVRLLGDLASFLTRRSAGSVHTDLGLSVQFTKQLPLAAFSAFLSESSQAWSMSIAELRKELLGYGFVELAVDGVRIVGRLGAYFMAQSMVYDVCAGQLGTSRVAERFAAVVPGDILAYMDAEFIAIRDSQQMRSRVISNLADCFLATLGDLQSMNIENSHILGPLVVARKRIACEQLGYFLGLMIGSGPESTWVGELIRHHDYVNKDALIRRGLTVGLGQGGKTSVVDDYVTELREERDKHDDECGLGTSTCNPGLQRKTNIEFNVVLYGDQTPESGDPDRARQPSTLAGTLSGMISLLEIDGETRLGRLALFIIADLYDYHWGGNRMSDCSAQWRMTFEDNGSSVSVPRAEKASGPSLRSRLERMLEKVAHVGWPEVAEVRERLGRIK